MPRTALKSRALAPVAPTERFTLERFFDPLRDSTLAKDVRRGLGARRKWIPPKHFYDAEGAVLFDRICDLPEYYLTRTEERLLETCASEVLAAAAPRDLVELGSGAARKTTILLEAAEAAGRVVRYRPFDVCEPALRQSARRLLARYPWLEVHAVVADYERHLHRLPAGERRLVAFLGSSIGNFAPSRATSFIGTIAARLRHGEHLLLGADLAKPAEVLQAAYDDASGVTAAFNRNVLRVVNHALGADFDPEAFDHVAIFDARRSQMAMYLRARAPQRAFVSKLGMTVELRAGETIHTEISRKFSRRGLSSLLERAGLEPCGWWVDEEFPFALVLARKH